MIEILPLFPKPVNGFTVFNFAPFFTGVFFISLSPSSSIYGLGLTCGILHTACQTPSAADWLLSYL
jgi:hypothetical protein